MHLAWDARQNGGAGFDCALDLPSKSIWLAYYQILSRPTALKQLLSFGLPRRDIIEGGPPEDITEAFDKFFAQKIAQTKTACAKARQEMRWPSRRS